MNALLSLLKPLASLRLTVVLLSLSTFLILAGTVAQVDQGVWIVVDMYFRSVFVAIPFQIFVPSKVAEVPGILPFPGGLTLGVLLFFNLLAAHMVRFKLSWKRAGMITTHAGVLLLLVGEFVTGAFAKEGNMTIAEGESSNYIEDTRSCELAVIDPSDAKEDLVVVVPGRMLADSAGSDLSSGMLPFTVRILEWMPNSRLLGPMQASPAQLSRATSGFGTQVVAVPAAVASGVDGAGIDSPAAYVEFRSGETSLGTYLLTTRLRSLQSVDIAGKRYDVALRYERRYRPYSVKLIDFRHDRFVGTNVPRNFSSLVRLSDPAQNVDREVLISMNNPLRYAGETFYQASFAPDDSGTVLQVVRNPGWLLPYISCAMVTVGLLWHFGTHMAASFRRKLA
ncbi:MAG: Cytochrome c biosis protein Ccs1 [Planctomycetota bacterium]